jgi:hypothetical protein
VLQNFPSWPIALKNGENGNYYIPMRLDRLKSFALALPQTMVVKQWGECLVFKMVGKMFFLISIDGYVPELPRMGLPPGKP